LYFSTAAGGFSPDVNRDEIRFFNLPPAEPWRKLEANCIPSSAKRLPSTTQKKGSQLNLGS